MLTLLHPPVDGLLKRGLGALFPTGYVLEEGNAWHCPIDGCDKLFGSVQALGKHFKVSWTGASTFDHLPSLTVPCSPNMSLSFCETTSTDRSPLLATRNAEAPLAHCLRRLLLFDLPLSPRPQLDPSLRLRRRPGAERARSDDQEARIRWKPM